MNKRELGYCGVDCGNCQIRIAGESGNVELQEKMAKALSEKFKKEMFAKDIRCSGCIKGTKENLPLFGHCVECPVRKSAGKKDINTCADCEDFACNILKKVWSILPKEFNAEENLRNLTV